MTRLLNDIFDESKIKEDERVLYLILCEYFSEEITFKNKHFKKLKKKFKKEVSNETR